MNRQKIILWLSALLGTAGCNLPAPPPDMLYKLSESLVLIDKKNDACSTLIKLDKEYPDNKLKSKVAKKVSELNCSIPSE